MVVGLKELCNESIILSHVLNANSDDTVVDTGIINISLVIHERI